MDADVGRWRFCCLVLVSVRWRTCEALVLVFREVFQQNSELMVRLYWRGHLIDIPADEAEKLARDIESGVLARRTKESTAVVWPEVSVNAKRVLRFVHSHMEMNRVMPSRAQIAEHVGFKDKKSLIPIMDELEAAGWRRGRRGHRNDDWGGVYKRPVRPPFWRSFFAEDNPQMGDSALVQAKLI